MTKVEEKAEEYANFNKSTDSDFEKSILYKAYKDGYEQGQKEIESESIAVLTTKYIQLEKENHQLKNDYEMIDNCYRIVKKENEELKTENEGLKNQIEIDKKAVCDQLEINDKLKTENAELKETLQHREHCIDWITENYPEVISKYLERKE